MRFCKIWKYHKLPSPRTCWHFGWWKSHLKHQSRIEDTKTWDEKKSLDKLCKTPIQKGCLEFSISLCYFRWTQEQGSLYYQPKQYIRQFNDAISGWCYLNLPISRIQLPTYSIFFWKNITSTRPASFAETKKWSTVYVALRFFNVSGCPKRRYQRATKDRHPKNSTPPEDRGKRDFLLVVSFGGLFLRKESRTWKRKTSPGHINVTGSSEGEFFHQLVVYHVKLQIW